jgi:hypothetical protein
MAVLINSTMLSPYCPLRAPLLIPISTYFSGAKNFPLPRPLTRESMQVLCLSNSLVPPLRLNSIVLDLLTFLCCSAVLWVYVRCISFLSIKTIVPVFKGSLLLRCICTSLSLSIKINNDLIVTKRCLSYQSYKRQALQIEDDLFSVITPSSQSSDQRNSDQISSKRQQEQLQNPQPPSALCNDFA